MRDADGIPPTAPFGTGPADAGSCAALTAVPDGIRKACGGGAPCRDRWNAFIFACMSCGRPPALEALDMFDCGNAGLRAALTAPSGLDGLVMLLGIELSEGFRKDGSRIDGGFDGGVAKSWAAMVVEAAFSEVGSGDMGTCDGGEVILLQCRLQGQGRDPVTEEMGGMIKNSRVASLSFAKGWVDG